MSDIDAAKRKLPLPTLMDRLGLGKHTRKSGKCPFHDDTHNSFSVWKNVAGLWFWKCHAGCGEGDEITFLELHANLTNGQAIKRYLELAEVNSSAPTQKPNHTLARSKPNKRHEQNTLDWASCVQAFTEQDVERLAKWRGYSIEFCFWLKENELVSLFDNCIAFPVHDRTTKVVAVHYRLKDGSWRYHPQGAKVRPLVIGELVSRDPVHVFESQWDAFAFMDISGERNGIIITRSASNGAFIADLIPNGSTLYLWTQNDAAGAKWQNAICANTKAQVKQAKTPPPHKDLNGWTKTGATSGDLLGAILKAETLQETTPVWSPEKLFREIKTHITRYVVFSQPQHADVLALWVMHTWVADCADFTPYIYLHSPVMRCGKTQVHRIVEPLVKNPLRTCNISESALFREIADSHPTLLWDEVDSIFGSRKASEANENKRALLNAGFERGIRAIRMERGGADSQKSATIRSVQKS
jgi:CHC2-type zinc finger protein